MDVSTVARSRPPVLFLILLLASATSALAQPVVAIDLDPSTPATIESNLVLPGSVASWDVGVSVTGANTPGISDVRRIAFGVRNAFNVGGAVVTGITPLAVFDLVPGAPLPSFTGSGGEFQFGDTVAEGPTAGSVFVGGPQIYAVFRLHFGALPPGSKIPVFVGDHGPGSNSVHGGAGVDISGDRSPDGTPVFGTAAYDEGAGAGIDYRDAVLEFGDPAPCSQTTGPECNGVCPDTTQSCEQDPLTGECFCVAPPTDCGNAVAPECDGQCPPGLICAGDAAGGPCVCKDPPRCEDTAPECGGPCPAGYYCATDAAGGVCQCLPNEPQCADSAPLCGGECPVGFQCVTDPNGCQCQPIQTPCSGTVAPECNGVCPGTDVCRLDPGAANACLCAPPPDVPCADAIAPECNGVCTADTDICVPTPNGCFCEPADCASSPYPECGGACPVGSSCLGAAVTGECACVPDDIPCGQSAYPECGGVCPTGEVCDVIPGAIGCECRPASVPCSAAGPPLCNGDCPVGEECISDATGGQCFCAPPADTCSDSPFPECTGTCLDGSICTPDYANDACVCAPATPTCQDTTAPECNGTCPVFSRCEVSGDQCDCVQCDLAVPPGEVHHLLFVDRATMVWDPDPCAEVYNVYRAVYPGLPDPDGDKIANDYGTCFLPNLPVPTAMDVTVPSVKFFHYYLVTAENPGGEGIMGFTSAGALRPNFTPCP